MTAPTADDIETTLAVLSWLQQTAPVMDLPSIEWVKNLVELVGAVES